MTTTTPGARRKFFCIVARGQQALYERLHRAYANDDEVHMIVDRRLTDRRRSTAAVTDDRRGGTRRVRAEVEEALRLRGWALILVHSAQDRAHASTA